MIIQDGDQAALGGAFCLDAKLVMENSLSPDGIETATYQRSWFRAIYGVDVDHATNNPISPEMAVIYNHRGTVNLLSPAKYPIDVWSRQEVDDLFDEAFKLLDKATWNEENGVYEVMGDHAAKLSDLISQITGWLSNALKHCRVADSSVSSIHSNMPQ